MKINREIFLSLRPSPILEHVTVLPAHPLQLSCGCIRASPPILGPPLGGVRLLLLCAPRVLRKGGGLREKLEFWLLLTACWRSLSLISLVASLGPSVPRSLPPLL